MRIPFGDWLPDLAPFENPGATTANNVIPSAKSYKSFPNLTTYSTSLGGRCQGAIFARDQAGNVYNYAGDQSALYEIGPGNAQTWSTVTRAASGSYALGADDTWEFVNWGQTIIAVGGMNTPPQQISLGAANFNALTGTPPAARHIAVVRDFVVMGNVSDSATQVQRVRWSGINNANTWTADAATLADIQDLPGEGGSIQRVIGGEYGLIFQERAIWRMVFVGSPLVFQFDRIQQDIGALGTNSVISYKNLVFFLASDGFYSFDGSNVTPIGKGRVDKTFFTDLDSGYLYRVYGSIDPDNALVMWAYPGSGNSNGNPNNILIFNWAFNKWSKITGIDIQLMMRSMAFGYTLDGLDAVSTNIDNLPYSLDSRQWTGGNIILSAFDNMNRLGRFNGSAMAATVETTEFQPFPGMRSHLNEVTPIAEGYSASLSIAVMRRNVFTESISAIGAVSPNATGVVPVRSTARYHRIRMSTTNNVNFDHLTGVDVNVLPDGKR